MIRRALFALAFLPLPVWAESVSEQAQQASNDLQLAVAALQEAETAKDRVSALTQTIRAYEDGLAALREALRQAHLRQATLELQFQAKRDRVAQLLAVLSQMESRPGPLLLLHPSGPLGTVRSGMLLADVTPALQAEAETLKRDLMEMHDLRSLQEAAGQTLASGLEAAHTARTALSQAVSDRTELPTRFTEDPESLRGLLESADTLEAFAAGLALDQSVGHSFLSAKGTLPLPALGSLLLRPYETDPVGVRRPGFSLAVSPGALVTTPWPATIRYSGPLLEYGTVMVLEPGDGFLLILAGMEQVFGSVGQVIGANAPIGLMGGKVPGVAEFIAAAEDGGGARETETLYIELRQGAEPIDPLDWFAALKEQG